MKKLFLFCFYVRKAVLLLILFFSYQVTFAQCNFDYEVKLAHLSPSTNNGAIQVQFKSLNQTLILKLYHVSNSEILKIDEREITAKSGINMVEFTVLSAGLYYLVAKNLSCEFSIGGIEGLTINQTQ